jgi:hypothetical protein
VGGEEEVPAQQFNRDAADRPDVSYLVPLAALQDDFRRAVLSCADDGAVSFVEERGSSEIDESDFVAFG